MPHRTLLDACLSGSAASVASTLALALCGEVEDGSAAGPINGPSQWLWGEEEAYTKATTLRHTGSGFLIHHVMSIFWATLYESIFGSEERKNIVRICAEAAAVSSVAYLVDYSIAPPRLRPGFKKHLGPKSIFVVYAAFAAGLAIASIVRQGSLDRGRPSASRPLGKQA